MTLECKKNLNFVYMRRSSVCRRFVNGPEALRPTSCWSESSRAVGARARSASRSTFAAAGGRRCGATANAALGCTAPAVGHSDHSGWCWPLHEGRQRETRALMVHALLQLFASPDRLFASPATGRGHSEY